MERERSVLKLEVCEEAVKLRMFAAERQAERLDAEDAAEMVRR